MSRTLFTAYTQQLRVCFGRYITNLKLPRTKRRRPSNASPIVPIDIAREMPTYQIQALVLYSNQSLEMMGVSDVQMESLVSASIAEVNEGFVNSEIGIDLTIVHQTRVSTYLHRQQRSLAYFCRNTRAVV